LIHDVRIVDKPFHGLLSEHLVVGADTRANLPYILLLEELLMAARRAYDIATVAALTAGAAVQPLLRRYFTHFDFGLLFRIEN
jgi:hypothetical protein